MSIRNGEHTYEGLMNYATNLTGLIEQEYKKSKLPDEVDPDMVDDVFRTIAMEKILSK